MTNELIQAALLLLRSWSQTAIWIENKRHLRPLPSLCTTCSPCSESGQLLSRYPTMVSDLDPFFVPPWSAMLFVCFFCPLPLLPRNPIWRRSLNCAVLRSSGVLSDHYWRWLESPNNTGKDERLFYPRAFLPEFSKGPFFSRSLSSSSRVKLVLSSEAGWLAGQLQNFLDQSESSWQSRDSASQ